MHFFGNRQIGVNNSAANSAWRFGQGNVFVPQPDTTNEEPNAVANLDHILKEQNLEAAHPGIFLQSQYTNIITVVDDAFLSKTDHKRDSSGRIIIAGDGLFTTQVNIPLLNKSGDAHAIVFESEQAVGIIVGAWKCLSENIIDKMLQQFKNHGIRCDQITVFVGPGLGTNSYGIGKPTEEELRTTFGDLLETAIAPKINPKPNKEKYCFNVLALMQKHAEKFGFNLNTSESADTFDKIKWKEVKTATIQNKDQSLPIKHYRECSHYSARLYARVDRLARRIAKETGEPVSKVLAVIPESYDYENIQMAGQKGRYNETGRCLNFVMRR